MKDHLNFRIIVCITILIIHFIGLIFNDRYSLTSEWVTIGTCLTVVAFFFLIILFLQIRYAIGKTRSIITEKGAAILNPIFGVLISKWLYVSFMHGIYFWPIAVSAVIFFSMPLLGNLIYTGVGKYRSVYFYALGQVILVGTGIYLEMLYFEELKSLFF